MLSFFILSFVGYSFSQSMDNITDSELKELNLSLTEKLEKLESENSTLAQQKSTLEKDYQELLHDSPECLTFQTKYNEMMKQNEEMKNQLKKIEGSMESDPKFWFLIGPGVFIVGLLFGFSSRKRKRTGLL
jgi:SH3 domain protein